MWVGGKKSSSQLARNPSCDGWSSSCCIILGRRSEHLREPSSLLKLVQFRPNPSVRGALARSFGNFHSPISIHRDYGPAVAAKIVEQDPAGSWSLITNLLGDGLHSIQSWRIEHWLGGDYNFGQERPGPITLFPSQLLWDWVNDH